MKSSQEFIVWIVGIIVSGLTVSSVAYSVSSAFGRRHVDEYAERGSPESEGPEMHAYIHGGERGGRTNVPPGEAASGPDDWARIAAGLPDPPLRRAKDK